MHNPIAVTAARLAGRYGKHIAQRDWRRLTVQAAPDWSAEHLEEDAQSVAEAMLSAYLVITGLAPGEPRYIAAHRWRYARVIRPAPADAPMVSQQGDIAIAGDWVKGARVEDAFLSGRSAMDMLLASATHRCWPA